jgi:hypothetical protein
VTHGPRQEPLGWGCGRSGRVTRCINRPGPRRCWSYVAPGSMVVVGCASLDLADGSEAPAEPPDGGYGRFGAVEG